jgi:hypothetical protein
MWAHVAAYVSLVHMLELDFVERGGRDQRIHVQYFKKLDRSVRGLLLRALIVRGYICGFEV